MIFFFESPFSQKKIMGRAPMMRPFFFFETPIFSKKKLWARFLLNLLLFLDIGHVQLLVEGISIKFGRSAHFPPRFFFLKRPLSQQKKIMGGAPMSFFSAQDPYIPTHHYFFEIFSLKSIRMGIFRGFE